MKSTSAVLNQQVVEDYADHLILQHGIGSSCSEKHGDRTQQKTLLFNVLPLLLSSVQK